MREVASMRKQNRSGTVRAFGVELTSEDQVNQR
jgi:hypothetical protein